jgi:hypothetical protein
MLIAGADFYSIRAIPSALLAAKAVSAIEVHCLALVIFRIALGNPS